MTRQEQLLRVAKFMDWTDETGTVIMDSHGNEQNINCIELKWDWVMEVIEKIATIDDRRFNVRLSYKDMCIWDTADETDQCCAEQYDHKILNIENTFNTLVEFVKYYETL